MSDKFEENESETAAGKASPEQAGTAQAPPLIGKNKDIVDQPDKIQIENNAFSPDAVAAAEDEEEDGEYYDEDEDDEDDDEYYDEDDDAYEDDGSQPEGSQRALDPAALLQQLSSNPLFAQVSQLLTGGMNGPEKLFTEARMLQATGDLEGAAQLYLDVIEQDPQHFKGHEALGQVLMAMDKPAEAEVFLQKAIDLEPDDYSGHLYMGYAHYAQQEYEKCAEDFQRSADLAPDNHLVLNNLGYAQFLLGRLEQAAQAFTTAGDYGSDRAYYNLGMVCLLQGREKEGWAAYQEAVDLDPRRQQVEDHFSDLDKALADYPEKAGLLEEARRRLQ